jgi:glycosyltransferase involved in cell wall biosynthesis
VCVLHPENEGTPPDAVPHAPEAEHEVWPFPVREGAVELPCFPLMIPDPNPRAPVNAWTYAALSDEQRDLFVRSFQARLRHVVQRFRPDVIECQHVWLMPYAAAALGLPYAVASHHSDQMAWELDAHTRPYATEAAQKAWRIFSLMEGNRREVIEQTGVEPEKVTVLGNGYDRTIFRPVEVDRRAYLRSLGLQIPDDAPIVTFAGKLSKTKGVDVLLEANRLLRERMSTPPAFLIFGTGSLDQTLDPAKQSAGDYSLDGCYFLGHQRYEIVREAHNLARASVMPSRSEGFGLAALEAMGCGVPVVVSRLGGLDAHTVGTIADPADPASLAGAIQTLLDQDESTHQQLRAEALRVARTFSWDEIVERRLAFYQTAPPMPVLQDTL